MLRRAAGSDRPGGDQDRRRQHRAGQVDGHRQRGGQHQLARVANSAARRERIVAGPSLDQRGHGHAQLETADRQGQLRKGPKHEQQQLPNQRSPGGYPPAAVVNLVAPGFEQFGMGRQMSQAAGDYDAR
jgi:hypothetical protein